MRLRANSESAAVILGFCLISFFLIVSGTAACKQAAAPAATAGGQQAASPEPAAAGIKEGLNDVAGTVKIGLGKYFYVPTIQGFDIAIIGQVDGGDAGRLVDKEVRVKGEFNREKPNLLIAQTIDVKESATQWKNVYTTTDKASPADYFDQKTRGNYLGLKITNINKSEDWEGKGKGKVLGKLVPGANSQGFAISFADDKGKEIGKIIIDSTTEFANYHIKKLRLFDTFWFYFNIKESVDKKLRPKNKELFHADVVFAGLY
jgi:hypothetical protein